MEQARTHTSATAATATSSSPPPSTKASATSASSSSATAAATAASNGNKQSSPSPSSACMNKVQGEEAEDINMTVDGSARKRQSTGNEISRPLVRADEDEDTVMDDENCGLLTTGDIMAKEYIEAASPVNISGGTITPHNNNFLNSDNVGDNDTSANLFKQFDSKTGQFLRNHANTKDFEQKQNMDSFDEKFPSENINNRKNISTIASSSLRNFAKGKFRSHSVPTISHSSLRRLTNCNNHAHYHYHQHNHNHSTNHSMMSTAGVQKKKVLKNAIYNRCIIRGNPVTTTGSVNSGNDEPTRIATTGKAVESTNNSEQIPALLSGTNDNNSSNNNKNDFSKKSNKVVNQSSLRKAILLCHQADPSLPKYQEFSLNERIGYIKSQQPPLPLPPINLQCLKEIDLQEIVKNPQLRHDIIFDPLLQFRPNLDGERGIKKRQLADKYWNDVENEIYVYSQRPDTFQYNNTRLVPLFNTLREVLLTIVPQREAHVINNVLDTELNVQELLKGSLVMTNLSEWLAQLFKHHCAPMRDAWVDKMSTKFKEAEQESSLSKLIDGLRLIFQILEAMKLDIANHQIRILRTALLSNSVEFEKQYFQSLMTSNRVNLKSSLVWFQRKFDESDKQGLLPKGRISPQEIYRLSIRSITSLLSCRKMVREYPTSLSFDHARLILLRADIRQIVCLLICRLLFKQLVANDSSIDKSTKDFITTSYTTKRLKNEIVSIITDDHGNCRWTKNTMSIAIHLCKVINDLKSEYLRTREDEDQGIAGLPTTPELDTVKIDFAKSWLSRQTQPLSEVYGVLENRVFKSLEESIFKRSGCTMDGRVKQDFIYLCSNANSNSATNSSGVSTGSGTPVSALTTSDAAMMIPPRNGNKNLMDLQTLKSSQSAILPFTNSQAPTSTVSPSDSQSNMFHGLEMEEFDNVYRHLYTVVNFHWSVFGCHYLESVADKLESREGTVATALGKD